MLVPCLGLIGLNYLDLVQAKTEVQDTDTSSIPISERETNPQPIEQVELYF